ncbi:transmembrane protein 79-like [Conger conger]|uniref:transmembrane protein 79-like n=1 Tax=Conger conger TaxID=82655 RepID=UPI002A59DF54|nr:transmembrane protein 79-like [Conger conger]
MTSAGHLAVNNHEAKEFDSVKESISDIINQLQDIDPARLSFSPFLDLDTQISLAPVSDSPESSVEELHSPDHSVPGSQQSLEPALTGDHIDQARPCNSRSGGEFPEQQQQQQESAEQQGVPEDTVTGDILEGVPSENCTGTPPPALQGGEVPNGREGEQWSPLESTNLDSTVDEGRPLIRTQAECIEMDIWDPQEDGECDAAPEAASRGRCCCRCCRSGRVPALCSTLASLLCLPGVLYALYFYVPLDAPDCPDLVSRLVFTLQCCAVAAVPILLAMVTGAVSRFCAAALDPVRASPRGPALHQLFVAASLEQLSLYTLNLLVMASFLAQDQLRAVPILAGVFMGGRLVYWLSLHICSPWRGFGSGLTVFPLLAMVAFNLYCLFDLGFSKLFPGSDEIHFPATTPSPPPSEMAAALRDTTDHFLPADCLDTQRAWLGSVLLFAWFLAAMQGTMSLLTIHVEAHTRHRITRGPPGRIPSTAAAYLIPSGALCQWSHG